MLLSARQTTLQKITVLLTQAKRGSQAGARKKCQTKGVYLVSRLLPLITQHYCLCSVQPQQKMPGIGEQTESKRAMRVGVLLLGDGFTAARNNIFLYTGVILLL